MRKSKLRFWGFLAPSLIAFCIVVIIPTCIGFFYSLTNWNGIVGSDIKFVGFQNFIDIFTRDDSFVHAFLFTALFSVCAVVLVNLVGFALALLVTQKFRGATLLRGIFFMPNMIGGLLLGFTWQFIFISIFEAFSKKTGIAAFSGWLSNPETGFIGLLILTVWQMSGYMMIVYIAQIQQIPESVKEAARIDGANSWQLMRYIILPLMMPAFTIGLFLSISSSFKMFDQNLALTQGGPYKSTEMIALNIYNSAFGANEFGFAQAKAIVFLIFAGSMLIPFQCVMLPLVGFASKIGLLSRGGLIFMYMGFQTSMAIIMFHGFIKNIPEELEEAATIDGCGSIRLFISIVLPLMRTIIVTVAVINVMGTWNDFLLPSLIINKQGLQTLPLKTYLFFGQFAKRWDLASAGLVMCMAPIIIFYLFSQKYIVKGITEGAIK